MTGSRNGMTTMQEDALTILLHKLGTEQLHHGDCRGSDEQAHRIAKSLGIFVIGHPPTSSGLRAFCECDETRTPQPFIVRDHAIVLETGILLATPDRPEHRRSGTWTTVRFARRLMVPLIVIAPDGRLVPENFQL